MSAMTGPEHGGHAHFNDQCVDEEPLICGQEFNYTDDAGNREIDRCDVLLEDGHDGHDGPHRNELTGVTAATGDGAR